MRINKYISEAGLCSRREADEWIAAGRISVNGVTAVLGTRIAAGDEVRVDGELLRARPERVYLALNKPVGIECTTNRSVPGNIVDFVGYHERIFPVGRLDKDSEGLILLTNDGDVVNTILRSQNEHEKEYVVSVDRPLTAEFLEGMAQGVPVLGKVTKPCRLRQVGRNTFHIILTQGLNRQIRRMCEHFGYTVRRLQRIRIMHIGLGTLAAGKWRRLRPDEISALHGGRRTLRLGSGRPPRVPARRQRS
ncbi:MAG TPA: 23S rRNA pseudouridine(2604) synthase RluF [Steroidobacteraceae bacterium]|nr:23S rRNA pseudouridine(2604) synthase RluF [Steroidobacteraceae bacterium]